MLRMSGNINVEGVLFVAGRMIFWRVECVEVVILGFDFGAVSDELGLGPRAERTGTAG